MISDFITWTFNPDLISSPITIRWYGLMFAIGFILGAYIISKIFKHEGVRRSWVDTLFIYVVVCTIVGSRLGHVFFYDWDYYSQHLGEIVKVWHGGLASHGGAIGILIGVAIYSMVVTKRNMLWTIDRLVIPVALVGGLIRLGNLFNSEIFGNATTLPWGFYFPLSEEWQKFYNVNGIAQACHPTQIYEALCYFALFGVLLYMYWKRNAGERQGLLSGVFFLVLFTARFLIEFIKNPQEEFERNMVLNMGQLLSIPFIIGGIVLIIWAMTHPRIPIDYKDEYAPEPQNKE